MGSGLVRARGAQHRASRMVPAHAVDPAARRRGRRTQIQPGGSRSKAPPRRPRKHLAEIHRPSATSAADKIGIAALEIAGSGGVPREDRLAKARGEPLDLRSVKVEPGPAARPADLERTVLEGFTH